MYGAPRKYNYVNGDTVIHQRVYFTGSTQVPTNATNDKILYDQDKTGVYDSWRIIAIHVREVDTMKNEANADDDWIEVKKRTETGYSSKFRHWS